MLIQNKIFLRKRKTSAFWQKARQKHGILAKSRHSWHLTKITVSVISVNLWLSTVPRFVWYQIPAPVTQNRRITAKCKGAAAAETYGDEADGICTLWEDSGCRCRSMLWTRLSAPPWLSALWLAWRPECLRGDGDDDEDTSTVCVRDITGRYILAWRRPSCLHRHNHTRAFNCNDFH